MQAQRVKNGWVRAYSAGNPMEAELIVGLLQRHGIDAGLRSQGLMGGIGELPLDALHTPVWVAPTDLEAAREIMRQYETKNEGPDWTCSNCGEMNDPRFELCWQCGATPPTS